MTAALVVLSCRGRWPPARRAPVGGRRRDRCRPALSPSSAECTANRAARTVHFASPFGYDASAGIIDVYAAEKLGYFADLCLDVDFVAVPTSASPYALVSADAAQITGEGSAADAIVQEEDGSNFVGISTYGDTSDYALLTRAGITKLTQLEGKTLAYHTVLPVVLRRDAGQGGSRRFPRSAWSTTRPTTPSSLYAGASPPSRRTSRTNP